MASVKQWHIDQFRQKAFDKRAIKTTFYTAAWAQKLCTYLKNDIRLNSKNNIY